MTGPAEAVGRLLNHAVLRTIEPDETLEDNAAGQRNDTADRDLPWKLNSVSVWGGNHRCGQRAPNCSGGSGAARTRRR